MAEWSGNCLQCRRCKLNSWVRKILWRRKWQPTPGILPGESHGQRSPVVSRTWHHIRFGHDLVTKQQAKLKRFLLAKKKGGDQNVNISKYNKPQWI